jgi:hypothetical protein
MLTYDYLHRAEFWLLITTLIYFLMNGAQIFETTVIIPRWTANAPESFQLLKNIDLKTFWIVMHFIHEITFMVTIYFCWGFGPVRNWLLLLFAAHFAVRVWTLAYFAPNIIEFQRIANTEENAPDLTARAHRWKQLNYLRVGVFIAVSLALVLLYYMLMGVVIN